MNIGFIGGSIRSAVGMTHRIASQMDGRWQLAAGCFSVNDVENKETGEAWGVHPNRVHRHWMEMLSAEQGRLSAVVILTPTPLHAEMVIAAQDHGFPVICEKAMCVSAQESTAVCEAVQRNSGFLAVTYNYSGYPMVRELRSLIARGDLGHISQVHIEMPQEGFLRLLKDGAKPIPQDWRLHDTKVPTLALDLGVHIHHMIDFLTGERPLEVCAINNTFGHYAEVVDNTMCIARYTGNLDCQIWYGKTALGHSNGLRVRLYGTMGSAEWYQMEPEFVVLNDNRGHRTVLERSSIEVQEADKSRYNRFKAGHPAGFLEAFANYYHDIADCLIEFKETGQQHSPWVAGPEIAHEGLQMLEAMTESAHSGSWVRVGVVGMG